MLQPSSTEAQLTMLTEHVLNLPDTGSLNCAHGPAHGLPLLFLHGVLRCWQDFLPLIPALSLRWQVHALDFRGHGRSAPRTFHYRVRDYVEDAEAFLLHACPAPAVVCGHSLGAMVALAAAAGPAAERCRALILEDPPFGTMGQRMRQTIFYSQFTGMAPLAGSVRDVAEVARALAEIRLTAPGSPRSERLGDLRDAASLRFSAHCLKHVDPDVFTPILAGEWLDGYDLEAILSRVRCPVLLLQGDPSAGGMLRDEDVDLLVSLLNCAHVRLPNVGHLIHQTQTETAVRLMTAFLESLREAD
jgi:pimeloyl-ACP methyl ester carboxylesterase